MGAGSPRWQRVAWIGGSLCAFTAVSHGVRGGETLVARPGAAAADAFHLRRLDEDDHSDDDHSDDDHADDHHADDHHADDHSDDDHADDGHGDDGHGDDGHGDDGHGDDGHGDDHGDDHGHADFTYGSCYHSCHFCEDPACLNFWREDKYSGKFGPANHGGLTEMNYSKSMITVVLILITLCFEFAYEKAHHAVHHNHQSESVWLRHLSDYDRFTSELMVLGFLAFSVWVSLKSGFIKFLSGGRDVKWGPQTDIQLKETIEEAHMGIFVAMTIYFAALTTICDQCTAESDRTLQYERLLAMERSKGGQVVKTPHDGRLSVVKVAAVVTQSAKNLSLHDYKMLREAFVRAGNNRWSLAHGAKASEFNDDFHFALYLRVHLDALIMELIEIQPTTWIFVIFLLIIHAALARSQLLGEWIIYFPPLAGIAMLVALHVALTFYERIYCDEDRAAAVAARASGVGQARRIVFLSNIIMRIPPMVDKNEIKMVAEQCRTRGAACESNLQPDFNTRHGEPRQESSSGAVDDSLAAFAELAEDDDGRPPGTKVVAVDDVRAEDYAPPDDAALPPLRAPRNSGERERGPASARRAPPDDVPAAFHLARPPVIPRSLYV
ncbi:hypothetical protein JL722_15245 [Aureococcus anophagefferens]|nr:hypothetical protein JL722_15245 [Aureococcus anophagefferens]